MLTLDQVQVFCGTPTEVDGVPLDEEQANFLARTIGRIATEAGHPFGKAVELGVRSFRSSYELKEDRWRQREFIPLQHGRGAVLRHCIPRRG